MKEKPILFSGEMVRAILPGWKTNTRRCNGLDKVNESPDLYEFVGLETDLGYPASIDHLWAGFRHIDRVSPLYIKCPYGQPGHRLWVKQEHYRYGHWEEVPGVKTRTGRMKWKFVADTDEVLYEPPVDFRKGRHHKDPYTPDWHKRLARFMPKALHLIDLEIKNIRVERLQDISEEDAKAEGVECVDQGILAYEKNLPEKWEVEELDSSRFLFAALWQSINGPESWDQNPWVWVVEFEKL